MPMPQLKHGEVMVNVTAAGICGSDVNRVFKTGTYHFPTVIGHEFSGTVCAVSDQSLESWLNKRVGVFPLKPCFSCQNCKAGLYEMCTHYDYLGSRCDGGFAEYVAVPAWNLIELPESVSFEEAAMLEPVSVAVHALSHIPTIKDTTIAVIGPGTIGNLIAKVAKIKGCAKVVVIGRNEEKLQFAKSYGADHIINSTTDDVNEAISRLTDRVGCDIVVEGTGAVQSLRTAISIARGGGLIITLGNPIGDMPLEKTVYWQILRKQLQIIGTWNSRFGGAQNDWTEALRLIQFEQLNPDPLVTHRLNFDQLLYGLELMRDSSIFTNKVMLLNNVQKR